MITLLALALTHPAAAQDRIDAHGFRYAPPTGDERELLSTWTVGDEPKGQVAIGGLFEYADRLLLEQRRLDGDTITGTPLVDDLFGINFAMRATLGPQLSVAVTAPIWLAGDANDGSASGRFGDTSLAMPVAFTKGDRGQVGIVPMLILPTGATARLLGGGFGAGGVFAGHTDQGPFRFAANVGAVVQPGAELLNASLATRLIASAGASARLSSRVGASVEVDARPGLRADEIASANAPVEALGALRYLSPKGLYGTIGAASNLTSGVTAAKLRVFAGVGYAIGTPPTDSDKDGFTDNVDACPREPETFNGWRDDDGCPDELAQLTVRAVDPAGEPIPGAAFFNGKVELGIADSEGVFRLTDQMPGVTISLTMEPRSAPELLPPDERTVVDLGEGDNEVTLSARARPGTFKIILLDDDGDEMVIVARFRSMDTGQEFTVGGDDDSFVKLPPGRWRLLVITEEGKELTQDIIVTEEDELQPFAVFKVKIQRDRLESTREELITLKPVRFKVGTSELLFASLINLRELSSKLLEYPQIKLVEIQGHTSSEGSDLYNLRLSQQRVEAIVEKMVQNGVERERIKPVGYGEACPIASNETEWGRIQNRRVQVVVLDPPPPWGIPCHGNNPARAPVARVPVPTNWGQSD